jgi:AAA family ATP:ADP antiporter
MRTGAAGRGPGVVFAALMSAYFFLVVTTFWVLKPLKKGLFIRSYDEAGLWLGGFHLGSAEVEQLAKLANLALAFLAALVFALLSRRLRRQGLALAVTAAFGAGHLLFAGLLRDPGAATAWAFYLYGDLFSTVMVVTFFAFLNDAVTPDTARRLYGPIGLGGVLGGLLGAGSVATWIEHLDRPTWLGVCFGIGLAIAAVAWAAGRAAGAGPAAADPEPAAPAGGALEGVRLVARSSYLLAIVAIVACYEVTSTLLDFQFTSSVALRLDGAAIDAHFASVFAVTNATALGVQLLVTPLVLTRLGVGAGLLVLPAAALLAEGAFVAAPTLAMASTLSVVDNGLNYSIQQSSREALYVPTSRAEKYQAKAVIDMIVQRAAKVLAIAVTLGATWAAGSLEGLRWLGLAAAGALVVWIAAARFAARRFRALSGGRS